MFLCESGDSSSNTSESVQTLHFAALWLSNNKFFSKRMESNSTTLETSNKNCRYCSNKSVQTRLSEPVFAWSSWKLKSRMNKPTFCLSFYKVNYSLSLTLPREERLNITSMLERETRREKHLEDAKRKIEDSLPAR